MAQNYTKIHAEFWSGETGREIRKLGASAQVTALYLMTCQSSNAMGLFYLPIVLLAHETGSSFEGASEALTALESIGFVAVDWRAEMVWIKNQAHYQLGSKLSRSDKRHSWLVGELKKLKTALVGSFIERYREAFELDQEVNGSPFEGPSKPLPSPIPNTQYPIPISSDPPLPPVGGATVEPDSEPKRKRGRKGKPPADWQPTDAHRAIARERGVDFELELAKFRDHEFATPKSDYDATFRNWLRSATPQRQGRGAPRMGEPGWTRQPNGGLNLDDYMPKPKAVTNA